MKYKGKEVKIIQEYKDYILVEHEKGYKEGINKQELGLIEEAERPRRIKDIYIK